MLAQVFVCVGEREGERAKFTYDWDVSNLGRFQCQVSYGLGRFQCQVSYGVLLYACTPSQGQEARTKAALMKQRAQNSMFNDDDDEWGDTDELINKVCGLCLLFAQFRLGFVRVGGREGGREGGRSKRENRMMEACVLMRLQTGASTQRH